jgi:hypothetical protein
LTAREKQQKIKKYFISVIFGVFCLLTKIIVKYYFGGFSTENKIFFIFGGYSWPPKIRKPPKIVYFWQLLLAVENKTYFTHLFFIVICYQK